MKQTAGKWYIYAIGAMVSKGTYWNATAQNWTADPYDATLFDTRDAAVTEARAAKFGNFDCEVLQASRDLP